MQLFLHMIGDYVSQNHWIAMNKVKNSIIGYLACLIHSVLYSMPFLLIGGIRAVFVIGFTHFIIDKYRLAKYLVQLKNWSFTPSGFPEGTPAFISVWILFIVDNLIHITINYLAIKYL